jgi:hypothetical protein
MACLLIFVTPAWGFTLSLHVLEVRSRRAANPSSIVSTIEGQDEALRRGPTGKWLLETARTPDRLTLAVSVQDPLVSRDVDVLTFKDQRVNLTLNLVEHEEISYQYFDRVKGCFSNRQHDLCLAVFEYAAEANERRATRWTELRVNLLFYHALALKDACGYLRYDTCDKSVERIDALLSEYDAQRRLFEQVAGLPRAKLMQVRAAALNTSVGVKYDAMRRFYGRGIYDEAARLGEAALDEIARKRVELEGADITVERLRVDTASALSKHAQVLERDLGANRGRVIELYEGALAHLRAIRNQREPQIARDRALIEARLEEIKRGRVSGAQPPR